MSADRSRHQGLSSRTLSVWPDVSIIFCLHVDRRTWSPSRCAVVGQPCRGVKIEAPGVFEYESNSVETRCGVSRVVGRGMHDVIPVSSVDVELV